MADEDQVPAEQQPEQVPIDYSQESLEEIEARMQAGEGLIVEQDPETPEVPVAEPEPEATEEAAAEPEAVAEETPEVPEETPAEVAPDDSFEELRLQLELERTARERSELVGGRAAAELGELRKQVELLTRMREQPQAPTQDEGYQEQYAAPPTQPASQYVGDLQAKVAGLEQADKARMLEAEVGVFKNKHFDNDDAKFNEFIADQSESIQQNLAPYQSLGLDSQGTRKLLNITLSMALAEYRLAERKKQAKERVATQVPERKLAKQAASVSGSGGTPTPKPTVKSPEEMSAEEANAELVKEFGDGVYRRRRA